MATPQPVRYPVALERRSQALRIVDRPRYEVPCFSSCLSAIGAFLFLAAFTVTLLVVGPLVGYAIAGGH